MLFSKTDLRKLVIPLIIEQMLAVSVGLVDTVMVSSVGEAAVSGVSLVDNINNLIIQVLAALATGGAVVCSQYLGKKDENKARKSAGQLLFVMIVFSITTMIMVLFSYNFLLKFIFGKIDADVMQSAQTYFILSALSFPFLGIYNSGAALFRSMGNSKVSMMVSLAMNIINIVGNALLILVFKWGVLGAATATLISRAFAAVVIMALLHKSDNPLKITGLSCLKPEWIIIKKVLSIGIPSGLENGMFQIGKLSLSSLTSTFGRASIAANAICGNISGFCHIPGNGIGMAIITVNGRCIGADEKEQAKYYSKKLMKIAYIGIWIMELLLVTNVNRVISIFNLTPEANAISTQLLYTYAIVAIIVWPLSFVLPNVLRSAGDAKFTMGVSIISMWVFRVGSGYLLGGVLGLGVMGVWIGMYIDWLFRGVAFLWRYFSGKWLDKKVV